MYRYRLTAYFEDKETEARVAQTVIVIAEKDQEAIQAAKEACAADAVGGRILTLKVLDKARVAPGVVFRSDAYIPFQFPGTRPLPKLGTQPQPQA